MIVPKINIAPNQATDSGAESQLVEQVKHWGFLGSVCVNLEGNCENHNRSFLQQVIRKTAGYCDLLLDAESLEEKTALDFLNNGVSMLIRNPQTHFQWPTIPDDRVIDWSLDPAAAKVGDRVEYWSEMTDDLLTPEQLGNLIELKKNVLIDSTQLSQQPGLIADSILCSVRKDQNGLVPTVICDPLGIALGLAYSNAESLRHAVATRQGAYWSRSRNELWVKGKTSGATQKLLGIRIDCDRDCLRFTVTQDPPGFCHRKTHTCFGEERSIATVIQRLGERIESANEKSFTRKLATDAAFLKSKLLEEAKELSEASQQDDKHEVAWEAADVLYFSLVAMLKNGVGLDEVYAELARRMNRVVRRDP
jgi:phosphoribosyl-ATP pyrophosphohydrolase/phosphoribosyl-AMP cyclohydrolase/histidinol dehydrogenase